MTRDQLAAIYKLNNLNSIDSYCCNFILIKVAVAPTFVELTPNYQLVLEERMTISATSKGLLELFNNMQQ